jgi:hypothetical protein
MCGYLYIFFNPLINAKRLRVNLKVKMDFYQIAWPFRMMLVGPSFSGKTTFIINLILNRNKIISKPVQKLIYCAPFESSVPIEVKSFVEFRRSLPSIGDIIKAPNERVIIFIDDQQESACSSKEILDIFLTGRHHQISILLVVHNLFNKGKINRDLSLNCNYICLMQNIRNVSQVECLGRQIMPKKSKVLVEIFNKLVQKPFGFLLIDLTPQCEDIMRLRGNIFGEFPEVYISVENYKTLADGASRTEQTSRIIFLPL